MDKMKYNIIEYFEDGVLGFSLDVVVILLLVVMDICFMFFWSFGGIGGGFVDFGSFYGGLMYSDGN